MELIDKQKQDDEIVEFLNEAQLDEIVKEYVTTPVDEADRKLKMMVLSLVSDLRNARGDLHSTQEEIESLRMGVGMDEEERHALHLEFERLEARAIQAESQLQTERNVSETLAGQLTDEIQQHAKTTVRAIQAEQERDRLKGELEQRYGFYFSEKEKKLKMLREERNALLEGLKWYAQTPHYRRFAGPSAAEEDAGERARSIIAQIEGSKPE